MLRERGQTDEAEQLHRGSLQEMLAAVRGPEDTDATLHEKLNAIFAVETERVANAAVLAELLAPLLTDRVAAASSAHAAVVSAAAPSMAAPPPPSPPKPERRAASIADFIDEMIAQDKPPERRAS